MALHLPHIAVTRSEAAAGCHSRETMLPLPSMTCPDELKDAGALRNCQTCISASSLSTLKCLRGETVGFAPL